jgi:hypothetical protein
VTLPHARSDVYFTRSRTLKKENLMKSRKLELETLEVRSAPASLIGYAPLAEPMTNVVIGVVATPKPAPAPNLTALATQAAIVCKLAVNHNETLVRDRTRARKRQ